MRPFKFRVFEDGKIHPIKSFLDFEESGPNYWSQKAMEAAGIVLMQFTGLKDKNGVEIYEGDILNDKWGCLFVVRFGEYEDDRQRHLGWNLGHDHALPDSVAIGESVVIGNIYENPELVE